MLPSMPFSPLRLVAVSILTGFYFDWLISRCLLTDSCDLVLFVMVLSSLWFLHCHWFIYLVMLF